MGQTVLEQPVGTRFLGVALGCDYLPFFKVSATAHNDLYFGIGDVLREFLPLTFPLFFLISLALVSFTLILFHLYQSIKSFRLLRHMLKSATLLQTQPIPLFESTSCGHSPLLIGIKRPLILLPRGLRNKLSDEELNAILKHERAHLLWKDHLAAPLIHIVCLTFWFVPLLRWYFRRLELAREMACDQSANHNPHALASALSKTTRHIRESHLIGALSFSSKKNCLKKRVESVLKYPRKPLPKWKKIAFSLASCFLAIFLLHSSIFPF